MNIDDLTDQHTHNKRGVMSMKNRWGKSLLLPLIAVFAAMSLLAGCGGGGTPAATTPEKGSETPATEASASAKYEFGKEPLEIELYGHYDWFSMPAWGGDPATKWILDNMKVTIKPILSGGKANQKLNTLIAGGTLPDVIWMQRDGEVERLRQNGLLVPFDEYLDKYPNLKEWAGEDTLNMLRSPDGKLYQFPNWYTKEPNGNGGYMLNIKMYKELGEPKIETLDDFYNYLKAVKAKYPNVIPFEPGLEAQGFDTLYSAFKESTPPTHISIRAVPNGDKLTSLFMDPTYRESMQFINKLYREGLVAKDALTQTEDQVKEKVMNGRVAVYSSADTTKFGSMGHAALTKNDPNDGYFMIWPFAKDGIPKDKIHPGHYNSLGWNVSVITTSAENPEAVFAFWDYMTGPEGFRVLFWGPEGLYWEGVDADGVPKLKDEYFTKEKERQDLMDKLVNFQWVGNTGYIDPAKSKFELQLPPEKRTWETRWQSEITWKTQYNATEFQNLDPSKESDEGIARQAVEDIYLEARSQALYAKSEEDVLKVLDKANADADAVGYSTVLDYKTKIWNDNKQKLGK